MSRPTYLAAGQNVETDSAVDLVHTYLHSVQPPKA
jgi:hypothetical protein